MAGFSELIKNFDKTRDYVRDFFVYGCKIRSDFDRKSLRTYSDEKRRVESWMGDYMRYDDSVRGRSVSISVDSGHIPENPLYNAYYSKSFTDNDIRLHFLIMDILYDGQSRTLKEITDQLNAGYGQLFDEQTVRNKLKEYVEEGIVNAVKKGKTMYYSLSCDRVGDYLSEFSGLEDALKFFSETQHFGIIGNSILKMTGLKNDLFFIKHNYMIHTLEDILMPEIMKGIDEKRYISFTSFVNRHRKDIVVSETEQKCVPMQVIVSVQTGRRYLAVYIPEVKRFTALRLDYIRKVKAGSVFEDYDRIKEIFDRNISHVFGVSFGVRKETGTVVPMKITFFVDEEKEDYIIERLEREKRCCLIEKTGDNLYTITADVFDPNEIMHWAKTFIGRIVKIEGGAESVRIRFYRDIERMKKCTAVIKMNIFSEIYGTYFRIAAKLLENEITDEKTVNETVMREGFRDSVLFLPQKLIPGNEDWGLFTRTDDGRLRRITKNPPVKVLTKLQKSWLKAKLTDNRIRLFMDDETLRRLDEKLADVKPFYKKESFRISDRFADKDNFGSDEYIANFRSALDAAKHRKIMYVEFVSGHGKRMSGKFVILKLEYSPKNGKFRAYTYLLRHDRIKCSGIMNIGRITKIVDTGRIFRTPVSLDDYFSSMKNGSPAMIRVRPERNGVERFMLEFASYEKHTVRNLETGEYMVELWYDYQNEAELLIQLLSFGPVIEIIGPPELRKQAKKRIDRQTELLEKYRKEAEND